MDDRVNIQFDGWTLLRRSGELARDGRRLRLQAQPLQILEALLEQPGELVTREQLRARLWPKGVVDFDTALNSAVHRLRVALDDHADTPRYIETIPRRGYRYVGPFDSPGGPAPAVVKAAPSRRPWPVGGLLFMLAVLVGVAGLGWLQREPASGGAGGSNATATSTARSTSAAARERMQRAEHFLKRREPGDLALALRYFREAVGIDPDLARAWTGMAGAYWLLIVEGELPPEQGLEPLRAAAERAIALDPSRAEPQLRLALYYFATGDDRRNAEHVDRALALEPDNPLVLGVSASRAAADGNLDAAIRLQQRAIEADPLSAVYRYNLASWFYFAARLDEAAAEIRRLLEMHPDASRYADLLGFVLLLRGQHAEALELASGWPEGRERRFVEALAQHGLGLRPQAEASMRALAETYLGDDPWLVAEAYAFRGEHDAAFAALQAGALLPGRLPWQNRGRHIRWFVPYSPFLQPLKADPRWRRWRESLDEARVTRRG